MSTHMHTPGQSGTPMPPPYGHSGGQPPTVTPFAAEAPISGIPAFGTLIQVLSSGAGVTPETYATIAGVGDITGPANSMGEVDTTSHSTGVPIKTVVPGLIDLGELSFPCFWNPDDPTQNINSPYGMEYLFFNRKPTKFQLVMPNASHRTRRFIGFPKQLSETYPVQGVCTRTVAIRITSPMQDVASPIALTPPSALTAPIAGGPGTFNVTTGGNNAPWTPVPDQTWITITSPTSPQVGDAIVNYTLTANPPGTPRSGNIQIAALSLTFAITQLGA